MTQFTLGMLLLTAFMLAALTLSNTYSYRVVTQNTVDTFTSARALYRNEMEKNLERVTESITETTKEARTDLALYAGLTEPKRYFLRIQWQDLLAKRMGFTPSADFLVITQPAEGLTLLASQQRVHYKTKLAAIDYFKAQNEYANDTLSEAWHLITIGGEPLLLQTFRVGNIHVGGAVRLSTLFELLPEDALQAEVQYLLTDRNGQILCSYGEPLLKGAQAIDNSAPLLQSYLGKWFVLTDDIGAMRFSMLKRSEAIFFGLEWGFWVILGLGAFSIAAVILGGLYLYRQMIRPINALYAGTRQIEAGNFDYRVTDLERPLEFASLTRSFNSMAGEILTLKIASYEAEIQRQKNELRFLQMQIRPHFYLNAITTISSFAYQNRGEDLQAYTEALSKYMRYLFREGSAQTTLKEEVEHAKAFVKLNRLKNPDHIYAMISIAPEVEGTLLPKYLILTPVENIFKHAYRQDQLLTLFLQATKESRDGHAVVHLLVEDNGPGFPASALEGFPPAEGQAKIGLGNLSRMLALAFGQEDLMQISNAQSGGARVEFWIPLDKEAGHAHLDCG